MKDESKTKKQLILELETLRKRVADLEATDDRNLKNDEALKTLVDSMVGNVGLEFFEKTSHSLNKWLKTDCLILGELVDEENIETIAMILDGKIVDQYSYKLSGAPCESTSKNGFCVYPEGVQRLFPADKDLVEIGAEGYVGSPLRDKEGNTTGVLCAMSRSRLNLPAKTREVLEIIASRASVEIERRRTEKALLDSQAKHNEAQKLAHIGHWTLDLAKNHLTWSDEVYRIFGLEPHKVGISYEAFLDLVHPEDMDYVNRAYTDSIKNGTQYDIVHRLLMKDGRIKYVNERCITLFDDEGKPLRSLGTVQDITERKLAEEELKRVLYYLPMHRKSPI